jgi:sulfate adenylyltransferase subunit 2
MENRRAEAGSGQGKFDAAFGGARRDEEKSRARSASSRSVASHACDPKNQRPELCGLYNTRCARRRSMRVFPISNWTELDVWAYILREHPIVPLYFAAERPTVRARAAHHGGWTGLSAFRRPDGADRMVRSAPWAAIRLRGG